MRYYGGKGVHGKKISITILHYLKSKNINTDELIYLEPFSGALGVFRYIAPLCKKSYANDYCKDLIMLWKEVQKGTFKNPKINEKKWRKLKYSTNRSPEKAFAGFGCSFGGVWFNGYIKDIKNNDMQYNTLIKMNPKIQKSIFSSQDYKTFLKQKIKPNKKYLIYLDPPYQKTCTIPWTEKNGIKPVKNNSFNSDEFWKIVKYLGKNPNITVLISETYAPKEFKVIKKFKRESGMHNITTNKKTIYEKIYTI